MALRLAAVSLTAKIVPGKDALAQQKVSKESMPYQGRPNGGKQCGNRAQFMLDNGCKIVAGTISPQAYCLAWQKKS